MTATKRHRPIVFAIVCALVLVGGSLEAPAQNLGDWTPTVTDTYGEEPPGDDRKLHIDFNIVGVQVSKDQLEVCGRLKHTLKGGGTLTTEPCGSDELQEGSSGGFTATFFVPALHETSRIPSTSASIKVRILILGQGSWMESAWTQPRQVDWWL